jgi:hypothetical protein
MAVAPDPSISTALPRIPGLDAAAVKAVRNSLPGKLLGRTAAILATIALVLGFAELTTGRMENLGLALSPAWLNSALLIGLSSLIIAVQLLNGGGRDATAKGQPNSQSSPPWSLRITSGSDLPRQRKGPRRFHST